MGLQTGQLITALFLPTSAEVKKFEPRTGYFLLEVVLHNDHQTYKPLRITSDQLAQIQIAEPSSLALTDNAKDFFFLIEAVYHYILESPCIRFLIADDLGAGKTIIVLGLTKPGHL